MFIGNVETLLDGKGRLALGSKWHLELASGFIVTRGIDPCLCIFTSAGFELLVRDLGLTIASSDIRAFTRHLAAFAEPGTVDKQGRIVIPPVLRQFASLNERVTVIGVVSRLEVWNSKKFAEVDAQSAANIATVAEKIVK